MVAMALHERFVLNIFVISIQGGVVFEVNGRSPQKNPRQMLQRESMIFWKMNTCERAPSLSCP